MSGKRIIASDALANTEAEFHYLIGSQAAVFIAYCTYVCRYEGSIWAKFPQLPHTSLPIF